MDRPRTGGHGRSGLVQCSKFAWSGPGGLITEKTGRFDYYPKQSLLRDFSSARAHSRLTSMKRFTNLKHDSLLECKMYLVSFHISYEFEYFYQWIKTFYGFEGLQGTHMDALNPFKVCEPFSTLWLPVV